MKQILGCAFMVIAFHANAANWTMVAENESGKSYIEPSTIARQGKHVKIWILQDFHELQAGKDGTYKYLSRKGVLLFSCQDKTFGTKSELLYEGNMGTGRVLSNDLVNVPFMLDIAPNSEEEAIYVKVCPFKK
jgi:hypothetical protein